MAFETAPIGEPPTKFWMQAFPIASVMIGSALPFMLPLIASSAILPPLGLLLLLCWRLLHPTLWPVWIGLPLGLWDDLFSGQPIGTAIGLWTLTLLAIDFIDQRTFWRGYGQDWLIAAGSLAIVQLLASVIALPGQSLGLITVLVGPQIGVAVLIFPFALRLTARLDNLRLRRRR